MAAFKHIVEKTHKSPGINTHKSVIGDSRDVQIEMAYQLLEINRNLIYLADLFCSFVQQVHKKEL